MAKKYPVVGADFEVELDIPLTLAILPKGQTNQRPGYSMVPAYVTQHENGNPRSRAVNELAYFRGGAEGRQASYHFVLDSDKCFQMVPIDENAWHAGDGAYGTGNRKSIAVSIAQGDPDQATARHVAEQLVAGLELGLNIPTTNTRQHFNWTAKNCPQWIRRDGYWQRFLINIDAIKAKQSGPSPEPVFADPLPIPELDIAGVAPAYIDVNGVRFWFVGDLFEAVRETGRYRNAELDAPRVGQNIRPGEQFVVDWVFEHVGEVWGYTPWDTRVRLKDLVRVNDVKAA